MNQAYHVNIQATLINGEEIAVQLDKLQEKLFEVKKLQGELATMLKSLDIRIAQV